MCEKIDSILNQLYEDINSENKIDIDFIHHKLCLIDKDEIKNIDISNYSEENKISPLELSIITGDLFLIKKFLTKENVNFLSCNKSSYPLLMVITGGYLLPEQRYEIVNFLIKNGASVNIENKFKETPLNRSLCLVENQKIVLLLLENGAKIEYNKLYNKNELEVWLERNLYEIDLDVLYKVQKFIK